VSHPAAEERGVVVGQGLSHPFCARAQSHLCAACTTLCRRSRGGEDIFRNDGCMLRIGSGARPAWSYTTTLMLPPRRCMGCTVVGNRMLMYGGCEGHTKQIFGAKPKVRTIY
jgi:hypothetical protein